MPTETYPEGEPRPARGDRLGAVLCIGALAAAAVISYAHVFASFHEARFVGRWDLWWHFGPNQVLTDHAVHQGELPLWNPLLFCGTPHAANPQAQLFYPPNRARSLLTFHPTPLRTHVGLALVRLFHLAVAALGAFALARSHRLSHPASLVAALAFAFGCGYVWMLLTIEPLAACATWMPLLLWCGRRAFRAETSDARLRGAVGAGLVLAMILLAGYPQLAVYAGLALAVHAVMEFALDRFLPAGAQKPPRISLGAFVALGAFVPLLAALLSAALLLPAAEFAALSTRARDAGYAEAYAFDLDTSPLTLARALLVYPGVASNPYLHGAGILCALLALGAMLGRRRRECLPYLVLFAALLDCGIGPPMPLATLAQTLAPFQAANAFFAWYLAALPLAVLAAFGVDALAERARTRRIATARRVVMLAAGAGAIALAIGAPDAILPVAAANIAPPVAALVAALAAVKFGRPAIWRMAFAGLVFCELMLWTARYVPYCFTPESNFVSSRNAFPDTIDALRGERAFSLENRRGVEDFPTANHRMYDLRPVINGYDPLHLAAVYDVLAGPQWQGKYTRLLAQDSATTNPRWSLFAARPFWLARRYVAGRLPAPDRLFPPAGTVFLPDAKPLHVPETPREALHDGVVPEDAATVAIADPAFHAALAAPTRNNRNGGIMLEYLLPLSECPSPCSALRLHYRSARPVTVSATAFDAGGDRHYLPTTALNPSENASFELPLYAALQPRECRVVVGPFAPEAEFALVDAHLLRDPEDEDDRIRILRRTANGVELRLEDLPDWRLLLFTDAAYPGWRVHVDGARAPLLTANDAFKAVEVPPGTHDVRFEFRSRHVIAGICISLMTFALSGALLIITWRRARDGGRTAKEQGQGPSQ